MEILSISPEASRLSAGIPRIEDMSSKGIDRTSESKPNIFSQLLSDVVKSQDDAAQSMDNYAAGLTQNIHETMLSLQKSSINFTLLVNVRNKLLDAYQQIMRMN